MKQDCEDDLISVVIPCYNASKCILESIDSALNQTYKNIEIIVVDDCSLDDSYNIVKEYFLTRSNVKLYKTIVNSGMPAVPRNLGVQLSSGEYIAFLDADDIWHPQKLEIQCNILKSNNFLIASSTAIDFTGEFNNNLKLFNLSDNFKFRVVTLWDQMAKYRTPTSSLLLRNDIAKSYPFPDSYFLRGREDLVQSLYMHSCYDSVKVDAPLVFYRVHSGQISANKIKMVLKVLWIVLTIRLKRKNFYKIFFPYFMATNILQSIYYRVFKGRL